MKYGRLTRILHALIAIGISLELLFIVGSILAASGTVLFFGIAENGVMSAVTHAVKEFHEFWGPVMWGCLGIHAGATMVHLGLGHRSILSIFRW